MVPRTALHKSKSFLLLAYGLDCWSSAHACTLSIIIILFMMESPHSISIDNLHDVHVHVFTPEHAPCKKRRKYSAACPGVMNIMATVNTQLVSHHTTERMHAPSSMVRVQALWLHSCLKGASWQQLLSARQKFDS